jgi:hypothetical protein
MEPKPNFQFYPAISPKYIESLFLPLQSGEWYSTSDLKRILRGKGQTIEGSDTITINTKAWSLAGLGESQLQRVGNATQRLFRLSSFGRQVLDSYSTNTQLFFDLMHFVFYSTWTRSLDVTRARFWLYAAVSDTLWILSPSRVDSAGLTNRLQIECRAEFPRFEPSFNQSSVAAPFRWLSMLEPPFLSKCQRSTSLCTCRRTYCSPQLFHLAADLVYMANHLSYGTSMSVDDDRIAAICKVCLLDSSHFWDMAELAKMSIRGLDIRKGQWGTSIALDGPPNWIELPDFRLDQSVASDEKEDDA